MEIDGISSVPPIGSITRAQRVDSPAKDSTGFSVVGQMAEDNAERGGDAARTRCERKALSRSDSSLSGETVDEAEYETQLIETEPDSVGTIINAIA